MEGFVKVAHIEAVSSDEPLVIEHGARRIAIFREGDRYYAIEDICPHMGAFLSHGHHSSGRVVCPWHNWEFELESGECISNSTGACIQTFPVQIVGNDIRLPSIPTDEMGEEFEE